MSLRIENDLLNVQRFVRGEQQIKVLKGFCQQETVHIVGLFFCDNVFKAGVGNIVTSVFYKIFEHLLAHRQVFWVFRELIQDVRRFHDLGP
jgi:hypothetical protein